MNLANIFSILQSRFRLAYPKNPDERHASSPLRNQPGRAAGPFLHTNIPHWAAQALEDPGRTRRCIALVSACRESGAGYLVHVLQVGSMQIRTLLPTSHASARRLFEHALAHECLNITLDIDETTQSLEMMTMLDRESASAALAAPQVQPSEIVALDEAKTLLALAAVPNLPSLIPAEQVCDVLVVYAGDTRSVVPSHGGGVTGQSEEERRPLH